MEVAKAREILVHRPHPAESRPRPRAFERVLERGVARVVIVEASGGRVVRIKVVTSENTPRSPGAVEETFDTLADLDDFDNLLPHIDFGAGWHYLQPQWTIARIGRGVEEMTGHRSREAPFVVSRPDQPSGRREKPIVGALTTKQHESVRTVLLPDPDPSTPEEYRMRSTGTVSESMTRRASAITPEGGQRRIRPHSAIQGSGSSRREARKWSSTSCRARRDQRRRTSSSSVVDSVAPHVR